MNGGPVILPRLYPKLMTVPFNEHPYSALAAYFKTDEGMEVLRAVEKQL